MIFIKENKDCCGCNACAQRCPKHCIVLKEDIEGFLYPHIDLSVCVDCGLCEQVCPVLNQEEKCMPLHVYAAKNNNEEIRLQSSSGGIFTLLSEKVLDKNGIVFGARFDENWEVKHDYTESIQGLATFRGSKYVQSRIEDNYKKLESFLKEGRKVMFSGTPCQIAGLKKYLRKEYDNLITVDFICHGVPSPKVWRMYLDETIALTGNKKNSVLSHSISKKELIRNIEFRSKSTGWKKFSFVLTLSETIVEGEKNTVLLSSVFSENIFMRAFLSNLILRPSCYQCPFKSGSSGSDITIADFWGIDSLMPSFDDDKGIGLVLVNSQRGQYVFDTLPMEIHKSSIDNVLKFNSSYVESVKLPLKRKEFFSKLDKEQNIYSLIDKTLKMPLCKRIKHFIRKNFDIIIK